MGGYKLIDLHDVNLVVGAEAVNQVTYTIRMNITTS